MEGSDIRAEALELGNQARLLLAADQPEKAKELLERALDLDPMCPELYDHMGAWYMAASDFKKAKESFKKALLIDKKRGETYFNLGNACLMLDQLSECIESYNRAVSAGFDHAELQFYLALAYEEKQDFEMAIRHLGRAAIKDPSEPEYRVKKAQLQIRVGRLEDAEETAEELIQTCPELFDGYHLRTVLFQQRGERQKAINSAREASELFPEDVALLVDYARCVALSGDYDGALAQLERAKSMKYFEEERPALAKLEAEIYAERGDLDRAIKAAQEAVALEEERTVDGPLHQLLMNLLLAKEDYPGLLSTANGIVDQGRQDQYYRAALYYRAMSLRRLGREKEAKQSYREALTIYRTQALAQPGLLDTYLYRALTYKDLEEYDKALEMVDFLLALDENQAESRILRAEILKSKGQEAQAQAELERAWRAKPELRPQKEN